MKDDERELWLLTAYAEIESIPCDPFLEATAKARQTCDHPAKIIPAIISHSKEWADRLRLSERKARRRYENANAPILENRQDEIERGPLMDETARILSGLKAKAKSERGAWSKPVE